MFYSSKRGRLLGGKGEKSLMLDWRRRKGKGVKKRRPSFPARRKGARVEGSNQSNQELGRSKNMNREKLSHTI